MTNEKKVANFFQNLENDKDLLLFYRLYKNPSIVLEIKQDTGEEDYNLQDYYNLILNNNLTDFILAVYQDEDFRKKTTNDQIWKKLHSLIWDSIDFKKYYYITEDEDLINVLENKMSLNNYLSMNKSYPATMESYSAWKRYKKLFDYHYSADQVGSYDERKANLARYYINTVLNSINEKKKKQTKKDAILFRIAGEDCSENAGSDTILYMHPLNNMGLDSISFDSLVCENRFLDIINQKLQAGELSGPPLINALNIIKISIGIKRRLIPNSAFYRSILGEDLVKEFSLEYADELVKKLEKQKDLQQKSQKIIKLNKYKH